MLRLFGGGGGNGDGRTRWQGKSFRVEKYQVTVEEVLAEGEGRKAGRRVEINQLTMCVQSC